MSSSQPNKFPLKGIDYFELLLHEHMKKHGQAGNIARIQFDLAGQPDVEKLKTKITQIAFLRWVNSLKLENRLFRLPHWVHCDEEYPVKVRFFRNLSNEDLFKEVLNAPLDLKPGSLFQLDVVSYKEGKCSVVLSVHHALLDHKGMFNLMDLLNDQRSEEKYLPESGPSDDVWKQLKDTFRSTAFLLKSPPWPLARLRQKPVKQFPLTKFKTISFSLEDTVLIDKKGLALGALLGKSSFYLAATTRSVNKIIQSRTKRDVVHWIPVPLNLRPRGTAGPVVSNYLSFLFYKINSSQLDSLKDTVSIFNHQMKEQIKNQVPKRYSNLMNVFRRLPLGLYLTMVNLPTLGAVSSFSFSDLGETKENMDKLLGFNIEDIHNYPPVPSPPGLTFSFARFNGALRIIIGYVEEVISTGEVEELKKHLLQDLLPA